MFTRAPDDTPEILVELIRRYGGAFQSLVDGNEQDSVDSYRSKAKKTLHSIDRVMVELLLKQSDTITLLTEWAFRMNLCRQKLDILDKNIAFKGKRQWNWDEVIQAMSFIEAVIRGAKNTLAENGVYEIL